MNGPLRPTDPPESPDLLDRVLGYAPLPTPDAWFTARTLARCRSAASISQPVLSWSRVWRRWAVAGVFTLCVAGFGVQQVNRNLTLKRHHRHRVQEAFEVMARVDSIDSDSSWQDSSL